MMVKPPTVSVKLISINKGSKDYLLTMIHTNLDGLYEKRRCLKGGTFFIYSKFPGKTLHISEQSGVCRILSPFPTHCI